MAIRMLQEPKGVLNVLSTPIKLIFLDHVGEPIPS